MMVTREIDGNGNRHTKVLGFRLDVLSAVAAVMSVLVAYATPIIYGTVWLTDQTSEIRALRRDVGGLAEKINPVADATLRAEVARIKDVQNNVIAGQTAPQQLLRSSVDRVVADISDLNRRCGDVNRELTQLRRDVDRLNPAKWPPEP